MDENKTEITINIEKDLKPETSTEEKERLIDGRCSTCTGVTYFSHAMSKQKSMAMCIGLRKQREVPPVMINIEAEAKRQISPAIYEDSKFYFIAAGVTVATPKMESEGLAPLSIRGIGLCNITSPSVTPSSSSSISSFDSITKPTHDQAITTAIDIGEFPFSETSEAIIESSKKFGSKVVSFWSRGLENYPEKYLHFSKRLVSSMEKTAYGAANFASKMFRFWVPKGHN